MPSHRKRKLLGSNRGSLLLASVAGLTVLSLGMVYWAQTFSDQVRFSRHLGQTSSWEITRMNMMNILGNRDACSQTFSSLPLTNAWTTVPIRFANGSIAYNQGQTFENLTLTQLRARSGIVGTNGSYTVELEVVASKQGTPLPNVAWEERKQTFYLHVVYAGATATCFGLGQAVNFLGMQTLELTAAGPNIELICPGTCTNPTPALGGASKMIGTVEYTARGNRLWVQNTTQPYILGLGANAYVDVFVTDEDTPSKPTVKALTISGIRSPANEASSVMGHVGGYVHSGFEQIDVIPGHKYKFEMRFRVFGDASATGVRGHLNRLRTTSTGDSVFVSTNVVDLAVP